MRRSGLSARLFRGRSSSWLWSTLSTTQRRISGMNGVLLLSAKPAAAMVVSFSPSNSSASYAGSLLAVATEPGPFRCVALLLPRRAPPRTSTASDMLSFCNGTKYVRLREDRGLVAAADDRTVRLMQVVYPNLTAEVDRHFGRIVTVLRADCLHRRPRRVALRPWRAR